jgi:antitoxin ParD1/3/4
MAATRRHRKDPSGKEASGRIVGACPPYEFFTKFRIIAGTQEKPMATMTISLPDPMKEWVEARIQDGEYASSSDYVRDLIRRDRERRARSELSLDDLRRIVAQARESGDSPASVSDVLDAARALAKGRND